MSGNKRGFFIVFEGPEGCGKTSIINGLKENIEKLIIGNREVIFTREPGGNKIAEQIRNVILDKDAINMHPYTEALLYAAARQQHAADVIIPSLENGNIVICDRFVDSSIAYQGIGRNLGINVIEAINEPILKKACPNLVIFLDVAPEIGLKRISDSNRQVNRLDLETLDFHAKVYNGYKSNLNTNTVIVDANQEFSKVLTSVILIINNYFFENNVMFY